ncbi:hypothetical protein AAFF_G00001750 [Aldrovandia affinis]|uniref:Uncharacterized protein n=1 Tax=Aldrovandia affinis TaxID=143900 RepID=A0AAD7X2G3_9TELE|nr:hypothetical protein AAFF_G00001750 [Aldrovandia affinis]
MALEKTYNRDAKTKLFTGISQQPAAMEKYLRALPVLTAVSEQTKVMAHLDMDDTKHHEDSNSQGTKEAESVRKITDVINNQMINPFTCEEQELMNISTGHKSASADLVNAREKGLEALAAARKTDSEKIAPIKLATFAAKPKKSLSMALKAKNVYEEESAVVRNLYFVQDLDEDKKVEVFSHEWTSCPASLFEPDPSLDQGYAMHKGNKADYLAAIKTSLGSSWREVDRLPPSDKPVVMVVDAMAFIQHHQHLGSRTFHELQVKYLKQLHIAYSVQHLHHKWAVVVATCTDVIMMCIYYITYMDGLQELW